MTLAELKEKSRGLTPGEQAELVAFLAGRLRGNDPTYRNELTRLIDDRDPEHWQSWSEVKRGFGD